MIGTHLDILPGVDDGPETMQESLALARALVQEGIHTAIATPHYNDEFLLRSPTEIRERVNHLQRALDRYDIPLPLLSAQRSDNEQDRCLISGMLCCRKAGYCCL
jgi:protein-tyrosine phosphatase